MFDFATLYGWVKDGLLAPSRAWAAYHASAPSWQASARSLLLPLLTIAGVAALLLTWLFNDRYLWGGTSPFGAFLLLVVFGALGTAITALIANFFAGKFGGEENFDQAFAAATFALMPSVAGQVLGTLPLIGPLLGLLGAILGVVYLYQALPVFLAIPAENRVKQFVATIVGCFFAMLIVSTVLFSLGLGWATSSKAGWDSTSRSYSGDEPKRSGSNPRYSEWERSANSVDPDNSVDSGEGAALFGFGREAKYLEEAGLDRYQAPADGELTEAQVERAIHFLNVAEELRAAATKTFERVGEKGDGASLKDLFSGLKGAIGAGTAEMQAVKSGNGNWAEHEWVKTQLFQARVHKDLDPAIRHNYRLYERYSTQLDVLLP